jgi:hypothetical protein
MFFIQKVFFLTLLTVAGSSACISQTTVPGSEESFLRISELAGDKTDAHQQLLNGIYYENPYYNAIGHPFLNEGDFHEGDVIFQNSKFRQVRMKYDICHQQLVVNPNPDDQTLITLLSREFVSEFWLGGIHYRKFPPDGKESSFYQVILEEKDIKSYRAWKKIRYKSLENGANLRYRFSETKQKSFLEINGKLSMYHNNSSFLSLLPDKSRSTIRSYLRSENIKLKQADMDEMKALIHFCQGVLVQDNMKTQ